ncbi:polysaccharide deacetylase [Bacteroidia bacterium]|nr:polysaccharide deacetylase [Bacteroidia bacterium]
MNALIRYIFDFLTDFYFFDKNESDFAYTADENDFQKYKIVIKKSNFFDKNIFLTKKSLPTLPLKTWEGIPLLFGEPTVEKRGETIVLNADIIASSFFLLSRYEELINKTRDEHNRFPARTSLPFRANFLHRPIVDEYGRTLRNLLRNNGIQIPPEKQGIAKIYLTHDIDKLAHYRNFHSFAGAVLRCRNLKMAFKTFFGKIENDEWYTFPFIFEKYNSLNFSNLETIFFILKENKKCVEDKTNFSFQSSDFKKFIALCDKNNVKIGLHASYAAGKNPALIAAEKSALERATDRVITSNRNHYLRNIAPRDLRELIQAGITDDFTMTYADCAGFRLGTAHSVRWLDPEKLELTPLILHPLTVMDNSLSSEKYMNLSENEAFDCVKQLIDTTAQFNGELSLLWHNPSFSTQYHLNLYTQIIDYLNIMNL